MSGNKLKLVRKGEPDDAILSEDLSEIQSDPKRIAAHFAEMKRLCKEYGGLGLAANQVGLRENFFFVSNKVRLLPNYPGALLVINPTWEVHRDGRQYTAEREGCLSLPRRLFDVERYSKITATWDDTSGSRVKPRTLSGLAAQVFQHECDHLKGVLLTDVGVEIKLL